MANKGAFGKFLDDNTKGPLNKAFLGLSAVEIAQSDNKLKALVKTLASLIFFKPLIAFGLAGAFGAMGKSIRSVIADTGSLQAVLKKLTQIQGLQRVFAPLVGGAEAARLKVAALVNFAASNNLDFSDVGEAAKSLQVMTHGAYASTTALQAMGDTAAATGNGIKEVSAGTGDFYAALRAGQPVAAAAENLRQMGVLSDANVNSLTELQQTGASSMDVFNRFTQILEQNRGALRGMQGDVAAVGAAYEAAQKNLQEKFASPFAASDIENTRNWTAAMNAIAPSVGRVAGFLEKLTNGFSTVYSWLAKTAAQSPVFTAALEVGVVVVSSLVAAVSALAAVSLASWLFGAAGGMIAFTSASTLATVAVRGLGMAMAATGVGLILAVIGTAIGIYMNFAHAADAAAQALKDQRRAHDEVADAMNKQIAAAKTLKEHQEALAKAIGNTKDAQKEYADAMKAKVETDNSWTASDGDRANATKRAEEARRNLFAAKQQEKAERDRVEEMKKRGILSPDRAMANIDVAKAKATLAGNNEKSVALANLGNFAQTYESLRKEFGDEGARSRALALTSGQIQEQAAAPAASSLARAGLGGEFGGGTDVQKQIRDLNKNANEYLARIDAKLGGGTPPNEPQDYDGT